MIKKIQEMFTRFNITWRIVALVIGALIFYGAAIAVFSYYMTTKTMYGEIEFWVNRIAAQIAEKSSFSVILEDSQSIKMTLDTLKTNPGFLKAEVFNKNGSLLAEYGNFKMQLPFKLDEKPEYYIKSNNGVKVLVIEYPVVGKELGKGKILAGQVRLVYSLERVVSLIRRIFITGGIVVLFAFLISGGIAFLFGKTQISDPARKSVEILTSSSVSLKSTTQEFRAGTSEQASSVQELTTSSEEIASAAKQIAQKASNVEGASRETFSVLETSMSDIKELIDSIYSIKGKIEELAKSILGMTEMSRKITRITGLIEDISEQTNLLAVNAAIEAAGAGEAGRRFGVVASEIRNLAGRTKEATNEIRRSVEEIQDVTSKTVMASETGVKAFDEVVKSLGRINTIFSEINQAASNAVDLAQEITLSTRQQVASSEQMTEALNEVNEVAHAIAENSAKIEELSAQLVQVADYLGKII